MATAADPDPHPRARRATLIIPADPTQPSFTPPRPHAIADLLRTRYCVPGSVLLVEAVEAVPSSRRRRRLDYRAVRLLVGDGELCVQALLRAHLHRLVDGGGVCAGAYVRLHAFEVRSVPMTTTATDADADAREMVFLVVGDLSVVGWDTAYMRLAGTSGLVEEEQETAGAGGAVVGRGLESATPPTGGRDAHGSLAAAPAVVRPRASGAATESDGKERTGDEDDSKKRKNDDGNHHVIDGDNDKNADIDDDDDDAFEAKQVSAERITQRRREADLVQSRHATTTTNMSSHHHHPSSGSGSSNNNNNNNKFLPWTSDSLAQPLKLTALRSIPTLPYKQNWVVNVLAVVAHLSDVEPAWLPPHRQRTARLADPSTRKLVHLTVFLEPDAFAPRVGSVVLLLAVKNHRFDGGSLKKYGNEKPKKGGSRWWYENPREIAWCDVEGMQRWWAEEGAARV